MSQTSSLLSRITIEDGKCGGRPCIRGQRMRVSDVLELLSAGADVNEILEDYPSLEREDVLAAIEFADDREQGRGVPPSPWHVM